MIFLLWTVAFLLFVSVVRFVMLHRQRPQRISEAFDGVVYEVGAAFVAERASTHPRATVVCMHGYLEDVRYFWSHYQDPDIQLLMVQSGDYHLPIQDPQFRSADWSKAPSAEAGTIEYDADVLLQVLQHLPKTKNIRVHGHSRGGAVVIEAAAKRPDLFREVEVILEAPVLPRAVPRSPSTAIVRWAVPFVAALWRLKPISKYNADKWGQLDNPRKRQIIKALPFSVRSSATSVKNLRSIERWRTSRDFDVYNNLARGVILVPDNDQILEPESMRESARHAKRLQTIWVKDASHFILYDQPNVFPPVVKIPA